MNKLYSRINWKNYPSEETALNETNLNKMDLALDNLDNRVIEMDATKVNKEVVNSLVQSWLMDESTGIITITHLDGSKDMFDLNIEKIPVNFDLSDDGILTMTTDDGSKFTASIGAMIPVLTFEDSDEIAVSVSGSGVNKTYSFSIKAGSVTEDKLQPNFLADVKTEVAKAQASKNAAAEKASAASSSATLAESYTHGCTGARDGEDTDNAKYYMQQAKAVSSVEIMTGATADTDGTGGVIPAPKAGQENLFLRGDGTWAEETAYIKNATGKSLALKTADGGIGFNKMLGESTQSQEPSPSSPQPIVSAGDSGSIVVDSNNINLINPTLETTTKNGVTCTKTDDGRYILNGTATDNIFFNVATKIKAVKGKTYRLCGIKDKVAISLTARDWSDASKSYGYTNGNNLKLDFTNDSDYLFVYIFVQSGTTLSNVEVRPMLSLNLTATYDDFKKYHLSSIIIPLTEPLRGIGDIKDEITYQNGKWGVLRRIYHKVFDGSEEWILDADSPGTNSKRCYAVLDTITGKVISNDEVPILVCSHAVTYSGNYTWSNDINCCSRLPSKFFLRIIGCTTLDQYKTWVSANKPEIIAPLATPVFEPFEDQNPFYELESYADNTYINTDDGIADLSVFYSSGNTGAIALKAYNESKKTKVITTSENTVTEEGKYAVDATQLNPNVSGSLAKKVSDNTTKLSEIETGANKYVHPTTSGNKHIPSGGAAGNILKWKSDGTAVWDFLSEIATYKFDNNGNTKKYIKLGTATIGNQGEYVYLEVFSGAGFNSNVKQTGSCKIYLRAGNGTAVNGKYYAGLVEYHLTGNADHNVYVLQNSSTSLTVYIEAPSYMGNSFYTAMCSSKASWTNQIEVLSTLPDGAALLEHKKIAYTDSFSNATQSTSGLMSASDKTKLDEIDTGANKTTSTDIQNAMKSNGVQVGTTYTFSGNEIKSSGGAHITANNGSGNVYAHGTGLYAVNGDGSSYVPVYASSFSQQSSKRYKKNIHNMTEEDARKLLLLRAVGYDYIEEKNGTNCYGFIAEEVNQLMKYPVIFNEEGVTEGLDYSKFVPYIIKLLQIQQKEIDDLKKWISS